MSKCPFGCLGEVLSIDEDDGTARIGLARHGAKK
jgi:hypothetical protein